ncbi:unnamed protein product [Pleuronectes platessa]|uniref:Uncharacterized protein n=1 Tax=Pleuronectes platessa TaxID=8262 RepID=A0A9N7Z9H0_PLEPL|nr:unnamed protein product [Pleuronectes platessa]
MEKTFCLKRRHINTIPTPAIEDIRSKWPYLFSQKCIYAHFELLTDLNVLRLLELAMEECGQSIIEYFRSKSTNKNVQSALYQGENSEVALHVVQLLMAHFAETPDGHILLADKEGGTLKQDVEEHLERTHSDPKGHDPIATPSEMDVEPSEWKELETQ